MGDPARALAAGQLNFRKGNLFHQIPHANLFHILLKRHHLIDNSAVKAQLDDTVRDRIHDVKVMRGEDHVAREFIHAVAEGNHSLHVEVIGRLVEQHEVRVAEHDLAQHATHLFAPGEHAYLLEDFLARKQHPAQEATDELFVGVFGVLPEPIDEAEVVFALEIFAVFVGEIVHLDGLPPFDRAAVSGHLAAQHFEEGRHVGTAVADQTDLVAFADGEGDVFEEVFPVLVFLAEVLDVEDLPAGLAFGFEADVRIFPGAGTHFLRIQFFEGLFAARGLFAFGGVGAEAADELLQFCLAGFGLLVFVGELPLDELRRLVPERIVPREDADLAVVDVHDVGADHVEEIAVVGNDDHEVFEVGEEVGEPSNRLGVQVVGRLIEQQHVGIAEEGLRKQHLHLLRAAKFLHAHVMEGFADAHVAEEFCGIAFGRPAAHLAELVFEVSGAEHVGFGSIGIVVDRLLLLHDAVHLGVAHDHGVEHQFLFVFEVVLLQCGHPFALVDGDMAARGVNLARNDLEQSGFARAIGTDHTVAVAFGEFKIRLIKKYTLAILQGEIGNSDHAFC
jgi:hypothetical protein